MKKVLDTPVSLCYTIIVKRERKISNTRKDTKMTVKELMELLATMPQNAIVKFQYDAFEALTVEDAYLHDENTVLLYEE